MNDAYYTQTGERPELAALEVNLPEGFIAGEILPTVPLMDKSARVYYATVTADAAAQTNRSTGSAPDGTAISDSVFTATPSEAVKRGTVTPDEAKGMGGIDKADEVGAKWAKRQVMRAKEAAVATLILGTADATFDAAKLMQQSQTAQDAIRLYEGKTALIAATSTLKRIVQALLNNSDSVQLFSRIVSGGNPTIAATGMHFDAWRNALAMYLGVDVVLAGDSGIWDSSTGSTEEKFAIAKLDDGSDPLSHKWKPVLGKVFQFVPDGTNPWVIQAIADRLTVNNMYDAYLWYEAKILNESAVYVFDGVAR